MAGRFASGMHPGWRILRWVIVAWLVVTAIVVLFSAFASRSHPELSPWHRWQFTHEVDAAAARDMDWAAWMANEQALFEELRAHRTRDAVPGAYRYQSDSELGPRSGDTDWNRSYASTPQGEVRGGVLLLHGLSDSPYSLHHVAALYESLGYVVVMPRMPGHGTAPSGLLDVQWTDWLAAVELAAREVRARVGADKPFHIVGYSNGGSLALKYTMDRAAAGANDALPMPDRLVLVSPMIGIGRLAAFSRLMPLLGGIPYFERSRWLDVQPEFNPFKYNSFPVNGVRQSWLITGVIQAQLAQLDATGRLDDLPPILAFQSVLDSTVSTPAVVRSLFDRLPDNGSELVLFDINRSNVLAPMFRSAANGLLDELQPGPKQTYRLTVITNLDGEGSGVVERRHDPGALPIERPLGLDYPASVYSLSHIALPFPMDDALYGLGPRATPDYGIRLGTLALHGERGALSVAADQLMRVGSNPFYAYLAGRIGEVAGAGPAADRDEG